MRIISYLILTFTLVLSTKGYLFSSKALRNEYGQGQIPLRTKSLLLYLSYNRDMFLHFLPYGIPLTLRFLSP